MRSGDVNIGDEVSVTIKGKVVSSGGTNLGLSIKVDGHASSAFIYYMDVSEWSAHTPKRVYAVGDKLNKEEDLEALPHRAVIEQVGIAYQKFDDRWYGGSAKDNYPSNAFFQPTHISYFDATILSMPATILSLPKKST